MPTVLTCEYQGQRLHFGDFVNQCTRFLYFSSSGDVSVSEGASELLVQPESLLSGQDRG